MNPGIQLHGADDGAAFRKSSLGLFLAATFLLTFGCADDPEGLGAPEEQSDAAGAESSATDSSATRNDTDDSLTETGDAPELPQDPAAPFALVELFTSQG